MKSTMALLVSKSGLGALGQSSGETSMSVNASPAMRVLARWLSIAAVALMTASCTKAQPGPDFSGFTDVRYYRNSLDEVVTLKIPNGYIDYDVVGGLPRRDVEFQMFFTAETTTLKPRSKENNQSFEFPASLTQKIRFNILSMHQVPSGERHERVQKILKRPFGALMRPCRLNSQPANRFGLQRYVIDPASCPKIGPRLRDDILVERDSRGDLKTVIECMPDDVSDSGEHVREGRIERYSPQCEQIYSSEVLNSVITINFSRAYSKDWENLQRRVDALLMSFVQTKQ